MKRVNGVLYVHRSALNQLPEPYLGYTLKALDLVKDLEPEPDVVSIRALCTPNDYKVVLTYVEDFDGQEEPNILRQVIYQVLQGVKAVKYYERLCRNGNPQIYHGKEMLVDPDYKGFDLAKAAERRAKYLPLKPDPKRMGYRNWWDQWCKDNNI